jgi:hypothetical protein
VPRHDLDVLSLMAGVFFAGVALLGLLDQGSGDAAGWIWPGLLILVGLIGLAATRATTRDGHPSPGGLDPPRDEDLPAG